jgi:hypothetical protein
VYLELTAHFLCARSPIETVPGDPAERALRKRRDERSLWTSSQPSETFSACLGDFIGIRTLSERDD